MPSLYGVGKPLIIFGEPPTSGHPCEGALYHPTSRQEHEAAFSLGQLDYVQLDPLLGRVFSAVVCADRTTADGIVLAKESGLDMFRFTIF